LEAATALIPGSVTERQEAFVPAEVTDENIEEVRQQDTDRANRHNQGAESVRQALERLDEISVKLGDVDRELEEASETNEDVTDIVSDETVAIANTQGTLAEELGAASVIAADAAERAGRVREKADMANVVGGVINNALKNLPIPGAAQIAGVMPQTDPVIPRTPTEKKPDGDFPYWLIPTLLGGGGAASLASKKVRGGVGKVFGKGKPAIPPKGPGESSDARFLGEALMKYRQEDEMDRERERVEALEEELADRVAKRRRRRQKLEREREEYVAPSKVPTAPQQPGNSSVFSVPSNVG